jgi:calcineurin-like phosphoesterase family protein
MEILKNYPNLFFTADWHFGHRFLVNEKKRSFATVEDMTEVLVQNHNSVVRPGDLVYVLGDCYLQITHEQATAIQKRLTGNHYLILGNHDSIALKLARKGEFVWARPFEEIKVGPPWFPKDGKKMIALCHYALRTWRNAGKGTWMLYGHSHYKLPEIPHYLSFDVGVDCPEWGFTPVSIEQVIQKMAGKQPAFDAWKASRKPGDALEFDQVLEDEGDESE